jgi:hypothetical protein
MKTMTLIRVLSISERSFVVVMSIRYVVGGMDELRLNGDGGKIVRLVKAIV